MKKIIVDWQRLTSEILDELHRNKLVIICASDNDLSMALETKISPYNKELLWIEYQGEGWPEWTKEELLKYYTHYSIYDVELPQELK